MGKQAVFTLTGNREGKTLVLNNRYQFVDGKMQCSVKDARKIRPILCDFFACTVEVVEDGAGQVEVEDPTGLGNDDDDLGVDTGSGAPDATGGN